MNLNDDKPWISISLLVLFVLWLGLSNPLSYLMKESLYWLMEVVYMQGLMMVSNGDESPKRCAVGVSTAPWQLMFGCEVVNVA